MSVRAEIIESTLYLSDDHVDKNEPRLNITAACDDVQVMVVADLEQAKLLSRTLIHWISTEEKRHGQDNW